MKKALIIAIGVVAFACNDATTNNTDTEGTTIDGTDESVEIGSGEVISPQLEPGADSAELLEVDTISSAEGTTEPNQEGNN